MRVLVVGANGLLGSNVVWAGQQRDWTLSGTYHSNKPDFAVPLTQFDLENTAMFVDVLAEHNPDVVVNCAAMTDVDDCEQHPERAYRINGKVPGELAATSESVGADFVHISTDYVFDGTTQEPYKESSAPDPIQV
jgi:dTDP-4-dehydrorhamnose reductase